MTEASFTNYLILQKYKGIYIPTIPTYRYFGGYALEFKIRSQFVVFERAL